MSINKEMTMKLSLSQACFGRERIVSKGMTGMPNVILINCTNI